MKNAGIFLSLFMASIFGGQQAFSQTMFQKVIESTAGDDLSNNAVMTADSGMVIIGSSDGLGSGSTDVYLTKTDANGVVEWDKTYGGVGADIGWDVENNKWTQQS